MKFTYKSLITLVCLFFAAASLQAKTLTIQADKWQLISFPRLPGEADSASRTVESVFQLSGASNGNALVSVWAWQYGTTESTSGPVTGWRWKSWHASADIDMPRLTYLNTGVGYWVKTSRELVVDLDGFDTMDGNTTLYAGWNLIGLSNEDLLPYDQALAGVGFAQLWSYDHNQQRFLSVQRAADTDVLINEDFRLVGGHRGYWVFRQSSDPQVTIDPLLETLLPPDIDVAPYETVIEYGTAQPWSKTAGDIDVGDDGVLDFPNTQSFLDFGDFSTRKTMSIRNAGKGVLSWDAEILSGANWLLIEATDSEGNPVLADTVHGVAGAGDSELALVVNRRNLAPTFGNPLTATLKITSGSQEKEITVLMDVADVVGDYEITVNLQEIDGKVADLHNPKYFLSFARDGEGTANVKAFLDEERSLLIPHITYLSGSIVPNPQSSVLVTGQLYLPPKTSKDLGAEFNPYDQEIRREFTFVGERSDGQDGLTPMDLRGEYYENVYGILDEPIQLRGEFVARRLSPTPARTDRVESNDPEQSDDENIYTLSVNKRVKIASLVTSLGIDHPEPSSLKVTLISPENTSVVLHQNTDRSLANAVFPSSDDVWDIDGLERFTGEQSLGQWKLKVVNTSQEPYELKNWSIDVSGANVYRVEGSIKTPISGATVTITGCGYSETKDLSGRFFSFDGLIPCDYDVSVSGFGYETLTTSVSVRDCLQVKSEGHTCETDEDFTVLIDYDPNTPLTSGRPVPILHQGDMKILVTPQAITLATGLDGNSTVRAVDITDYDEAPFHDNSPSRQWELWKNGSVVYLPNANGSVGISPASQYTNTMNLIANAEDSTDWQLFNYFVENTDTSLPPGIQRAYKIVQKSVNDDSYDSGLTSHLRFINQNSTGQTFSAKGGERLTFSVFVKAGTASEFIFSPATNGAPMWAEKVRISDGYIYNSNGLEMAVDIQSLDQGWKRISITTAMPIGDEYPETFESLSILFALSRDGNFISGNTSEETLYIYGPQITVTPRLWVPIAVGDITTFIPGVLTEAVVTPYAPTSGKQLLAGQTPTAQDYIVTTSATGVDKFWTYTFPNEEDNAGFYTLKLRSDYTPSGGSQSQAETFETFSVAYKATDKLHLDVASVHASAGQLPTSQSEPVSSRIYHLIEATTFDVDRAPLQTDPANGGLEDTMHFKEAVDSLTKTNEAGDSSTVIHEPASEEGGSHYRMMISVGQLYSTGSSYGSYTTTNDLDINIRLDSGVQSQKEAE
ncbi:Uncharacterised protein [BD1-7 clade bacterium]|uniref:P/Homo B domain-containing protein n=1 Tax=BD1-7 clade bacterium TaxID=2029982 RepID=A0A5S9Q1D7_9GAMM|nr:Uncharacterised protein [BD1-7 clade bacterium]